MIEHLVTAGTFSLDGQDFDVENNVWLLGDHREVLVIDAPHDEAPILDAIAGRRLVAIVATHGHNDHVNAAPALAAATGAPIYLHVADRELWDRANPDRAPDRELVDGMRLTVAGAEIVVLHTPGHTPGGCSLYDEENAACFSGDTLFNGGPGATGRSFSDFPTIIESIVTKLLSLPDTTTVYTGHGPTTTIGVERPRVDEWMARGY